MGRLIMIVSELVRRLGADSASRGDGWTDGGGGWCTVSVFSGSPDIESYTGHITNSCGYGVRIWISCVFVFDGMFDRSTQYSGSTLAPVATEKVSCDATDSVTGYGWQYNAGHGASG